MTAQFQEPTFRFGGVNINSDGGNITICGDVVGRDVIYKISGKEYRRPFQFPPPVDKFTGRTKILADLRERLQPARSVTLWGAGGRGKTAIAWKVLTDLHHAGLLLPRFPDGVIFHSFYGQPAIHQALAHIAQSLGVEDVRFPESAARIALGGKRVLLILDGAEEAEGLQTLLGIRGECGVLLTTRSRRQAPEPDHRLEVARLDVGEATTLLKAHAGMMATDDEMVAKVCAGVDYLALAVRLVGLYCAEEQETLEDYWIWMSVDLLDALNPTDDTQRERNVQRLLARTVAQLSNDAQTILTLVSQLAYLPFRLAVVQGALTWEYGQTRRALSQLCDYGLVVREETGSDWQLAHALVYRYQQRDTLLLDQLVSYYHRFIKNTNTRGKEGYSTLNAERPHILALLNRLAQNLAQHALSINNLVWAIHGYLEIQGHWRERAEILEIGVAAAQAVNFRYHEGIHIGHLGLSYANLGEMEKAIAHYGQALEISREIEDRYSEGVHLGNLGNAFADLGEMENAIDCYRQALEISREIGGRRDEGTRLGNLGLAFANLGEAKKTISLYEQALAISREIGDRRGEGRHLANLSKEYANLGEMEFAIEYLMQALVISREIGDKRGEGTRLGNLGNTFASLGQSEKAIVHYRQALNISREIGDRHNEGAWLGNLGLAYANLGEVEKAISHYQQALVISREIGDRRGEARHLGNLGNAFASLGEVKKAIDYHERGLEICREIGDRRGEGRHLGNLGNVNRNLGEVEKAIEYHRQALGINREIGDKHGEGNGLGNLGLAYADLGMVEKAIEHYEQASVIHCAIGDVRGEAFNMINIGLLEKQKGRPDVARSHWTAALAIFTHIGSPHAATVQEWLNGL